MRADGIDMKKDNQPEGIIVVEENQLKALLSNHNFGKKKKKLKKEAFESIAGKGENAGNQHSLFSKCFLLFLTQIQMYVFRHIDISVLIYKCLPLYPTIQTFNDPEKVAF